MAKIVDPDFLNQGTEVVIDTNAKTVQLLIAGNLNDNSPGRTSGVTGQALYSFLKEEWKADPALNKFKFPIQMIYEASFIWVNGWRPADQQTIDLIRDAGFQVQADNKEYACIISLGDMDDPTADLAYYQQVAGFDQTTQTFDKTGELNENILVYDASGISVFDYRSFLKVFLREQGKTYSEYNLLKEQGLSALTYQAYRLPLSNAVDIKVTASDSTIDTTAPYTGMSISYLKGQRFETWTLTANQYNVGDVVQFTDGRWYYCVTAHTPTDGPGGTTDGGYWEPYAGERQIGSAWYAFNRIIEGNGGTKEQIYEWAQRQLRKTTNINADALGGPNQNGFGTVNGNVAALLLEFVGDTLVTKGGVYIDNFDTNDTNSIEFFDITVDGGGVDSEYLPVTSTKRTFPFVAAGTLNFSSNLVAEPDADTLYRMYFTYITRVTGTDLAVANVSGNNAEIQSTSTDLSYLLNGDYIYTTGFANDGNNGLWQVTANGTATSVSVTKVDGKAPVAEAAGASVTIDENPFESPGAIVVNDNSGSPIEGQITASSVSWDFDYDNNGQGGRTPGTDAPVTVVAQGLSQAQWTIATATITRATGIAIAVTAADELNYKNP